MADLPDAGSTYGFQLCPVCHRPVKDLSALASHLVQEAEASDSRHVMWLNRNLTKIRKSTEEVEQLLIELLVEGRHSGEVVKR